MYNLTIDLPNLAKGAEVDIDGLGRFENGGSYEISDDEAEAFRTKHQTVTSEYDSEGNLHTTLEKGPTVAQAFSGDKNVTVRTTKKANPKAQHPTAAPVQAELPLNDDNKEGDNA
jgi:hypothetical protein